MGEGDNKIKKTEADHNELANAPINQLLKKFAVPSVIAMVVSSVYNITDQIFIGHGVGYLGNAATNVVFPVGTAILVIQLMLGTGSSILFNILQGQNQREKAARVFGNNLFFLSVFGIIAGIILSVFYEKILITLGATELILPYAVIYLRITAIGRPFMLVTNGMSYLIRSDGSPKYAMTSTLIGAVLNVGLDALFMLVFKWGMAGAAAATVIGQLVAFGYSIRYLKKVKTITLSLRDLKPDFSIFLQICKHGIAGGVNQLSMLAVQIVSNNLFRYYGALSIYGAEIPLACAGVIQKVYSIFFSVNIGITQGLQPIYGYNIGAKNYARVREAYFAALKPTFFVCLAAFVFFEAFPNQLIAIFGSGNELYMEFGRAHARITASTIVLLSVISVSTNFFSGIGKAYIGMILALSWRLLTSIPAMFLLCRYFGVFGISLSHPVADIVAAVIAGLFAFRELKRLKLLGKQQEQDYRQNAVDI